MDHPKDEQELLHLFCLICDGRASAEQRHWLELQLADNPLIQRYWIDFMATEADTAEMCRYQQADNGPADAVDFDRIFSEERVEASEDDSNSSGPRGPVSPEPSLDVLSKLAPNASLFARAIDLHRHPIRFLLTTATLTSLFFALLLAGLNASLQKEPRVTDSGGPMFASPFVARLISSDGDWSKTSRGVLDETRLFQGQSLDLLSGWAMIRFESGALATITGPATFAIRDAKRLYLASGTGRIEVRNQEAKGFVLSAPEGTDLTDLGTEFAVDVRKQDGSTLLDARVLEGEVGIRLRSGKSSRLTAGKGVRVLKGSIQQLPASTTLSFDLAPTATIVSFSARPFLSDADISTRGRLVQAVNLGSTESIKVNGVTFTADQGQLFANGNDYLHEPLYQGAAIGSLSLVETHQLFGSLEFGPGNNNSLVPLNGLSVGQSYEIQFLVCDHRPASKSMDVRLSSGFRSRSGQGKLFSPLKNLSITSGPPQVITGRFTAAETSVDLYLRNTDFGNGHASAYQLRETTDAPRRPLVNP